MDVRREVRYHPALPTLEEAQDDYELVISDHVPFFAWISTKEMVGIPLNEIKILSWNVLEGVDTSSGFTPLGETEYCESDGAHIPRFERIVESITKFVASVEPQFITLQEITAGSPLCKLLQGILRNQYAVLQHGEKSVDAKTCITFYNRQQFAPLDYDSDISEEEFAYQPLQGNNSQFKFLDAPNKIIDICNIHADFSNSPIDHEYKIRDFLSRSSKDLLPIVIGDFNCNIGPVDDSPTIITTSVSPNCHREYKLQGACAIDGAFYSFDSEKGKKTYRQARTFHLDPSTGWTYEEEALEPIDTQLLDDLHREEIDKFRMMISVDEFYETEKIINGKYTIFEYEKYLQDKFDDSTIRVRPARNLNNHSGIGIILDKSKVACIKNILPDIFQTGYFNSDDGIALNYVIAEEKHLPLLLHLFEHMNLMLQVERLKEDVRIDNNIRTAFQSLSIAILTPTTTEPNPSHAIVSEHFANIAEMLLASAVTPSSESSPLLPKRKIKAIDQSLKELDHKFYGKPPMSRPVKAAIFGIVGAIVGAAVGFAVGVFATAMFGGIGGFPAAMLGALKGFSVGTTIAILSGGGAVGSAWGCSLGFFNANYHRKLYKAQRDAKEQAQIGDPVFEAVEGIRNAFHPTPV